MNEGAYIVFFSIFAIFVVIYATMCSYNTIKYYLKVEKYEKRTVEIQSDQEIIINDYQTCPYAEIEAHYTEGNETHKFTLISSPPPYSSVFCVFSIEDLEQTMIKLMKAGSHVAKISPHDETAGYAFNFSTGAAEAFLVIFYAVLFPLIVTAAICLQKKTKSNEQSNNKTISYPC